MRTPAPAARERVDARRARMMRAVSGARAAMIACAQRSRMMARTGARARDKARRQRAGAIKRRDCCVITMPAAMRRFRHIAILPMPRDALMLFSLYFR